MQFVNLSNMFRILRAADFGWHRGCNSFGSMPVEILSSNKIIRNGHRLPDYSFPVKGKEHFLFLGAEREEHISSRMLLKNLAVDVCDYYINQGEVVRNQNCWG